MTHPPTGLRDFDVLALWQAVDDRRQDRGISWRQVMDEIGSAIGDMALVLALR